MKLTKEQIELVMKALDKHAFDVYADYQFSESGHEEWPALFFEAESNDPNYPVNKQYTTMGAVWDVLEKIEL